MNRTTRHARSFTLIETVAAVIILAVAIPPMMWAIREAQDRRIDPILTSRARWLATSKLEDIVADRHSQSGSRGYTYLVAGNYPAEATGTIAGYPQFSRSATFNITGPPPAFAAGIGYKHVTVTVGWTNSHGSASSFAVATIMTEYTP